ncbi:MAG: ROK family protein [Phycisphaeraceae bacterium]|nr:ROK family protein [Phycisphaeraceae bacterium]
MNNAPSLGLDLGGTDIKAGLVGPDAEVLAFDSVATEASEGPDHVIERMAEAAKNLCDQASVKLQDLAAIGAGVPGPLDSKRGVIHSAPNLPGWVNIPLKEKLAEKLGSGPVFEVFNDANAAAYGEFWAGTGRDEAITHMIMLTLGTGVGGGIILDGDLYTGAHGDAGELGHVILEPLGPLCASGERGSLEMYASATAMAGEARRRIELGASTDLPAEPTAKNVFDLSESDPLAGEIVDWACGYLGIACANLVRCFDPQMIVLGGGVAKAGERLLKPVRTAFEKRTWTIRPEKVRIELATLGNRAGFIGAAGLAQRACESLASEPQGG